MSKCRKTAKRSKQSGGSANLLIDPSVSFTSTGGVPFAVNQSTNSNCDTSFRVAPVIGGKRKGKGKGKDRKTQKGGCGCGGMPLIGGGSGNGGYMTIFPTDSSSKLYPDVAERPCLPVPVGGRRSRRQQGGNLAPFGRETTAGGEPVGVISSYPAGFALDKPFNSDNANFLQYSSYDRSCMGGGKRKKCKKSKYSRKQ